MKIKTIILLSTFFIVSCSHSPLQRRQRIQKELKPQEAVVIEEGQEPEPTQQKEEKPPLKLGLILGPGSVKTFAHTGVIKELEKARIPISYLVGIEWGALVGALYSKGAKINDTEWKLYKLQEKKLKKSYWLLGSDKYQTIDSYKEFFARNIGDINFRQLAIPFACPSVSVWSGTIIWQDSGSLKKAVERCMPSPPLFKPKSPWMASLFSSEEAVEYLKEKGMDVILYVDVLGKGQALKSKELMTEFSSALLWQELRNDISRIKNSEGIVKVEANTMQYKLYDFSSRSSLSSAGIKAGIKAADMLVEKYDF